MINALAKRIHQTAVDHGWWDCGTCDGDLLIEIPDLRNKPDYPWPEATTCPTCKGTGKHRNTAELLALVHSEVSEALEALRKPELDGLCDKCDGRGRKANVSKPVGGGVVERGDIHYPACAKCDGTGNALGGSRFAEELADVVIRVLDIAEAMDIDLQSIIKQKMAFNDTRPFRHGGKAL